MKKRAIFYSAALVFLFCLNFQATAQESSDCKVLLAEISDTYEGKCKRGLAHGKGKAVGIDVYEGKFKNGLPEGKGKYTWGATGNEYEGRFKKGKLHGKGQMTYHQESGDSVLIGYWENNMFIGKNKTGAKIVYKRNVTNVKVRRVSSAANKVIILFQRNGATFTEVYDLQLLGNSGFINTNLFDAGFNEIETPFEGNFRFKAPNLMKTSTLDVLVKFEVYREGTYEVTVNL